MSETASNLRAQIDQEIAAGHDSPAAALLAELWRAEPTAAAAGFVSARFEKIRGRVPLIPLRLSILRSFTVETIVPLLRAMSFVAGIDLTVQIGDFNTYPQEILDPASKLYSFMPDVVILAVQTRDVAPALWNEFAQVSREDVARTIDQTVDQMTQLATIFRQRSQAALIVHSLQTPSWPAMGVLDQQIEHGQVDAIGQINQRLADMARRNGHTYILDYDRLIARRGTENFEDVRKWLTARLPIAANEMIHLASEWMRFLHPLSGKVAKVLAVDLDNTLWGGVIGEDGMNGIKLSAEYPGAAYQLLQRAILDLHRRGVLLAICSKNNPAEANEAIDKHPGMLLRREHFAAVRLNWDDKAHNLRQIAAELNLGVDSIAFLDDNPVERRWIRSQLPEVAVLELPDDPMRFADALRAWPVFERLRLTEEDRQRVHYYAQERERTELQQAAGSLEDFYRSLRMKIEIAPMTPATMPRVAQLTQKTNQFNVTTRRYSEQQVTDMAANQQWRIYTLKAADRFGDHGLIGLAILKLHDREWEIDTLLMSCRVIGRTIETAFIATLAKMARDNGARCLVGYFLPTKKNAPAKDFFAAHDFMRAGGDDALQRWELKLGDEKVPAVPEWIEVSSS